VRVDCHLVLVLSEVLDGISHPRVALEVRHYELFRKTVRVVSQRFSTTRFHFLSKLLTCLLDPLPNNLLNPRCKEPSEPCGGQTLRVLVITWEVRSRAPPIVSCVGGSRDKRWWQGSLRSLCPMIPSGLRLSNDLNLSDELILDASHHVSLQSSLLALTSRSCPLLVQLSS